ncbi:MAG: PAS domain-containing protein [Fibrobacterales bacterium]
MHSFEEKSKDQLISELIAANEKLKYSSEVINLKNSELESAHIQIESNEILLNKTGEIAKVGGWCINLSSNTLTWTDEVYRIHELERSYEPTVEEAINFYDPESKDIIQEAVSHAIEQGEPFDVELGIITSKGNNIAVRAMGNVQVDGNGDQLVVGVFQDITGAKDIKNRLQNMNEQLQLAMKSANMGILEWDIKSDTITWSDEVLSIFGVTKESFGGTFDDFLALLAPEFRTSVTQQTEEFMATSKESDVLFLEYEIEKPNGQRAWVDARAKLYRDENGEPRRFIGVSSDVTVRKKMENRLLTTEKMEAIGQLAGGIAHDFNNILGAIIGYGDLICSKSESGSIIGNYSEQILKAGDRAKGLVSQILAFSRQIQEEKVALRLPPIIEETLVMLKASLPSSIEFKCHCDENSYPILADPVKIHEIVFNLCINAAYAMEDKGALEMACYNTEVDEEFEGRFGIIVPGRYSVIRVKDSGCGMSEEVLKAIFDPFFTTKEVGEGTGMGLAVVFGIVQNFEGNIVVTSALGNGSTFEIYLPATEVKIIPDEEKEGDVIGGKEHILLIDDEYVLGEVFAEQLMDLGYRVTVFNESTKALDAFTSDPESFDLIVTDQTMPHLTGVELAAKVQDIKRGVPIVLCTGYGKMIDETTAIQSGIKGFLMKPFRNDELAEKIRSVLSERI